MQFMFHMNYVIEGSGALVNEAGEETPLKAGDFALVDPSEKHQYRNKGEQPFKMIIGSLYQDVRDCSPSWLLQLY